MTEIEESLKLKINQLIDLRNRVNDEFNGSWYLVSNKILKKYGLEQGMFSDPYYFGDAIDFAICMMKSLIQPENESIAECMQKSAVVEAQT